MSVVLLPLLLLLFQVLGWFSLSVGDWARLIPFGVAVGGLSYLSLQVNQFNTNLVIKSTSTVEVLQNTRRNKYLLVLLQLKSTGTSTFSSGGPIP